MFYIRKQKCFDKYFFRQEWNRTCFNRSYNTSALLALQGDRHCNKCLISGGAEKFKWTECCARVDFGLSVDLIEQTSQLSWEIAPYNVI